MRRFAALWLLLAGCSYFECPLMEEAPDPPRRQEKKKDEVTVLFDGKSLTNWKATEYGGQGEVSVKDGELTVAMGASLSGVTWSGVELPKTNFEISLEAMKLDGDDFFCGICFPVGKDHCSFVCGGWGGQVVGLSSVDGEPAMENETCKIQEFKKNQWYKIRLRVTPAKIESWIDEKQMVNLELKDKKITLHPAMDLAMPLGIATYSTTAKFKNISLKKLP